MISLRCAPPRGRPTEVRIGSGVLRNWTPGASSGLVLVDAAAAEVVVPRLPVAWPRLVHAGGESIKTIHALGRLLEELAGAGLDRTSCLLVAGGGALGDLGGLAAALYLRGIRLVSVPTTLLAMVDSAVGGKTAINLSAGKNLAGTYWPAELVLIDPDLLQSLPPAQWRSGLGELLKMAIGLEPELFALLADAGPPEALPADLLVRAIELAVARKLAVVEADPDEQNGRRLLNLGHTLGHALELAQPGILHGEAVARGLHFALDVAGARGAITAADAGAARALLEQHGFPSHALPPRAALEPFLRHDKKVERDHIHFVLPTGRGRSRTEPIPLAELLARL